jgi:hypothetical protein
LVLCGSILPLDFRWDKLRGSVETEVINDCGIRDIWPILAQSTTFGYGPSGRFGFGTPGIRDRFHDFGHAAFFQKNFVRDYWLPWFRNGKFVNSSATAPSGARRHLLAVFQIKWLVVLCCFGISFYYFWRSGAWPRHATSSSQVTEDIQHHESLPPMAEDAFEVFNHDRVVDLAAWKDISPDQLDIPISKVLWHDRFKIKRRNPNITEFVLRRAVTGNIEPEFSSTTHRVTVKSSKERPLTGPRPIDRLYDVLIDVSNEPINKWFDVQIDSVYWNVFLDKKTQWVGIPVLFDTNNIRFELRSSNKPFTAFEREAYDRRESGGDSLVNDPTAELSQDGKVITWRIANPHKNWIYKINWEW